MLLFALALAAVPGLSAYDSLPGGNPFPNADESRYAVAPWAEIDAEAPSITLRFLFTGDFSIYRRIYGATEWGAPRVVSTGPDTAAWTDTEVVPGVVYEYGIHRTAVSGVSSEAFGYVTAGIRADRAGPRGTMILVIAENLFPGNEERLDRLIADLVGDGWKVRTVIAPTYQTNIWVWDGWGGEELHGHDGIWDLRRQIQSIYYEDPSETKLLYLLGHAPLALSGTAVHHPDNHRIRGPYVTDFFYADVDGLWTDILTSSHTAGTNNDDALSLPNVPGDGLFDQNRMPSPLEMGVGRMDPFRLDGGTDAEHAAVYLDKVHAYRHDRPFGMDGLERRPGDRAILRYNPGGQPGAVSTGLQFMALFGPDRVDDFVTSAQRPTPVAPNTNPDVQFLVENGPYLFFGANSEPPPHPDFGSTAPHRFSMQSHWGDWWAEPSSRRDLVNPNNQSLTWLYTGRYDTQHLLHPLGLGAPYGEGLRLSFNSEMDEYLTHPDSSSSGFSYQDEREFVHSFVGDPTLRLFPAPPPENLLATANGSDVELSWEPPYDLSAFVEYRVYRSTDLMGEFAEIARGLTETTFIDPAPQTGSNTYMVQAVHLQETGSGSYLNNSQGVFATAGLTIETGLLPPFLIGEDVDFALEVSGANGTPQWSLTGGSLPQGMSLSADGRLQGNPVVGGMFEVELEVADGAGPPVRRTFGLYVDAAFTEMMNLDLRGDGSGLAERTQYRRSHTIWGDPEFAPDGGMIFDGDDAIQVHDLATESFPWVRYFPFNRHEGFTFALAFKAAPDSAGGVLLSKAYNLNPSWSPNRTYYAVRMRNDGRIEGWAANRRITSSQSYNDGQWHYVVYTEREDRAETALWINGVRIGTASDGRKDFGDDFLIGARWADSNADAIADGFDGTIADIRGYLSGIKDGEARALWERFARSRDDLTPEPPVISGLPSEIFIDDPSGENYFEQVFQISDANGDPIKPVLLPASFLDFEALQVDAVAGGYVLRGKLPEGFSGEVTLAIGADDQWPGPLVHQEFDIRVIGAADDHYRVPAEGGRLDVLANDIVPPGSLIELSRIVSQPAQGHVERNGALLEFFPPPLWNQPVSFEYEARVSPSGTLSTARVDLIPANLPQAVDDLYADSGSTQLLDVASNDSDPEGEALTLVRVDRPDYGSARIVGGQIQYTPPVGGLGGVTDRFSYYQRNESGFVTSAMVIITPDYTALAGPLVELLFEEGSGGLALNTGSLGPAADGILRGDPLRVPRGSGGALRLDGVGDFLELGNPEALRFDPATDSFSVTLLIRPTDHASLDQRAHTLLTKMSAGAAAGPLDLSTDLVDFGSFDPQGLDFYNFIRVSVGATAADSYFGFGTAPVSYTKPSRWDEIDQGRSVGEPDWRLLSFIYEADSRTLSLYVDNWMVARTTYTGAALADNGLSWLVGAGHDGAGGYLNYLQAEIDELRIYGRALAPLELKPLLVELDLRSTDLAPVARPDFWLPPIGTVLELGRSYRFRIGYSDPDSSEDLLSFTGFINPPEPPGESALPNVGFDSPEFDYTPQHEGDLRISFSVNQDDGTGYRNAPQWATYRVAATGSPPTALTWTTGSLLPSIRAGAPAELALEALGGTLPHHYSSTNLPAGLALDSASGIVTGQIAEPGNHLFAVSVSDASGTALQRHFLLRVRSADSDGDGLPDDWEMDRFGHLGHGPDDTPAEGRSPVGLDFVLGAPGEDGLRFGESMTFTRGRGPDGGRDELALRFSLRSDPGGLDIRVLRSPDLLGWQEAESETTVLSDDGETRTVELRLPLGLDPAYFYRLEVLGWPGR